MLLVLSATIMSVDLFVAITQVIVSVAIMQLEVSATFMKVEASAANIMVTIFIEIMRVGVSVAIIQVVFSAVHYAHDYFYCNDAGVTVSVVAMYVTVSISNFAFLFLTDTRFL